MVYKPGAATVLVIDDEESMREGCRQALAEGGYRVQVAEDGEQGLQLTQQFGPDVVLVDLKMPRMPGMEVLEKIREIAPTAVSIVITGYGSTATAVRAMKTGASDFLAKPFAPQQLLDAVTGALERNRFEGHQSVLARERQMTLQDFTGVLGRQLKSLRPAFKSPREIVNVVEAAGCTKTALSWGKLLMLGFLAGAFIAFGGLLAIMVGGGVPGIKAANPGLQKLLFGSVFPVGLMLVVIAGSELFTGNTACCIPAVLSGKARWTACGRNWLLVYVGNFLGALFVAYFLTYLTGLLAKEPWLTTTVAIAEGKISQGFGPLFLKGVGCNWLVCLAVWLAMASNDIVSKIWGIWFPIMAFVALGFEHSVANMFFIPAGMLYGAQVTWGRFLIDNLVPVTLGNIVGGAFFVGGIYWYLYGREQARTRRGAP